MAASGPAPTPPRARPVALVVALLGCALHAWLAISTSARVGPTADEIAYLTAGYSYGLTGDHRLHPENGHGIQRLIGLPLAWQGASFPSTGTAEGSPTPAWEKADVWAIGREFFFSSGNDLPAMLAASRAVVAVLGAILAFVIFLWARSLFGWIGGLAALTLAVFCPNLLAHAGVATSDVAAALGFLLATLAWWRACHRITPGRIVAAGLSAGFLALSKYSAALFLPIAVGIVVLRLTRRAALPIVFGRLTRRAAGAWRLAALTVAGIAAAGIAIGAIWAAYGFRYPATPDGTPSVFNKSWEDVLMSESRPGNSTMADGRPTPGEFALQPGALQRFVRWAREHRLLPEAYLYGLAFTDRHARGRLAFFAGDYRETGWPAFFPVAFLLKTTVPAMVLLVAAAALFRRLPRPRRQFYRLGPLLILAAIYGGWSIASHLNIGHRHILPLYPIAYIVAGATAAAILGSALRPRWASLLLFAALAWHVVESVRIRPHYLTYFNFLAGGPAGGSRFLVDSSLDWGQGLPDLKQWLDRNAGGDAVFLSYFGTDDPRRLGIGATRIGDTYFDHGTRRLVPELVPGVYCISATMLRRVYTGVRGDWSESYESAYRRLNAWLATDNRRRPGEERVDETGRALSPEAYQQRLIDLEQLRFGRLCRFLASRRPDALVANSIFIYRLTASELNQAFAP